MTKGPRGPRANGPEDQRAKDQHHQQQHSNKTNKQTNKQASKQASKQTNKHLTSYASPCCWLGGLTCWLVGFSLRLTLILRGAFYVGVHACSTPLASKTTLFEVGVLIGPFGARLHQKVVVRLCLTPGWWLVFGQRGGHWLDSWVVAVPTWVTSGGRRSSDPHPSGFAVWLRDRLSGMALAFDPDVPTLGPVFAGCCRLLDVGLPYTHRCYPASQHMTKLCDNNYLIFWGFQNCCFPRLS